MHNEQASTMLGQCTSLIEEVVIVSLGIAENRASATRSVCNVFRVPGDC